VGIYGSAQAVACTFAAPLPSDAQRPVGHNFITTLLQDLQAHASSQSAGGSQSSDDGGNNYPASEATAVIQRFNALSHTDKQAILDFLRSL
jgi:hypothetical protein